uniref:Uncharacterized protein n=1 Tax=Oryza glumipatula TaxID=40148 RepID=A0A0E0ACK9_9ORYZ
MGIRSGLATVTALAPTAAASSNDDFNCSNGISTTTVAERERGRGMLLAWDPRLARLFWLAKFGQWEKDFGQPNGLAIRIASLLKGEIEPKLPKFNLGIEQCDNNKKLSVLVCFADETTRETKRGRRESPVIRVFA